MRKHVLFYLNGVEKRVTAEQGKMMLADYLRYDQCLTGTKVVCAEGDCGACSILRFFPHANSNPLEVHNYVAVNSCITPVASLDGSSLITIDALKKDEQLHETQRAMMECHGSQCGFCTPGFVMALAGLTEKKIEFKEKEITEQEAKNAMTGNLCRCTGYQAIIDAAKDIDIDKCEYLYERFFSEEQHKYLAAAFSEELLIEAEGYSFYAPKKVEDACKYLGENPDCHIVASATDLGVVHNKRKLKLVKLLSLHLIEDLYKMDEKDQKVYFGARVTFSDFRNFIKPSVPELANYIDVFASPQIKNLATPIGNICTASPIGDSPPAFLALDATVHIQSTKGKRELALSEFFLGYRKTDLKPGELVTGVSFDIPSANTTLKLYKNANRKDLDISAVNLGIRIDWKDKDKGIIDKAIISAGGVAATTLRFKQTEQKLQGQTLSAKLIDQLSQEIHQEFTPMSDLRASAAYRHLVVENLFRRSFFEMNGGALS